MLKLLDRIGGGCRRCRQWIAAFWAVALTLIVGGVASATDPVTLPDTGVDIAGLVTAAITALGAILVVIVGGYFAFLLIRKAMRWGGRALG